MIARTLVAFAVALALAVGAAGCRKTGADRPRDPKPAEKDAGSAGKGAKAY